MSNNSNEPLDYECCDEHEVSYMGACGLCLTEEINEMLAEPKAISLVDKDFLKAVLSFIPAPATSSDASELASVPLLDWLDDGDRGEKGFTGYNLKFDEAFRIKDALSALPPNESVSISRECASRLLSLVRENKAETPYVAEFENWGSLEKQLKDALEENDDTPTM
jgi:hypothetical protein